MLSADTTKSTSGVYTCQTCNSLFTCLDYYQQHRKQHAESDGVKLLTCAHCTYVSDNSFHYNWHIMSHASSPPHRCDVCAPSHFVNCVNNLNGDSTTGVSGGGDGNGRISDSSISANGKRSVATDTNDDLIYLSQFHTNHHQTISSTTNSSGKSITTRREDIYNNLETIDARLLLDNDNDQIDHQNTTAAEEEDEGDEDDDDDDEDEDDEETDTEDVNTFDVEQLNINNNNCDNSSTIVNTNNNSSSYNQSTVFYQDNQSAHQQHLEENDGDEEEEDDDEDDDEEEEMNELQTNNTDSKQMFNYQNQLEVNNGAGGGSGYDLKNDPDMGYETQICGATDSLGNNFNNFIQQEPHNTGGQATDFEGEQTEHDENMLVGDDGVEHDPNDDDGCYEDDVDDDDDEDDDEEGDGDEDQTNDDQYLNSSIVNQTDSQDKSGDVYEFNSDEEDNHDTPELNSSTRSGLNNGFHHGQNFQQQTPTLQTFVTPSQGLPNAAGTATSTPNGASTLTGIGAASAATPANQSLQSFLSHYPQFNNLIFPNTNFSNATGTPATNGASFLDPSTFGTNSHIRLVSIQAPPGTAGAPGSSSFNAQQTQQPHHHQQQQSPFTQDTNGNIGATTVLSQKKIAKKSSTNATNQVSAATLTSARTLNENGNVLSSISSSDNISNSNNNTNNSNSNSNNNSSNNTSQEPTKGKGKGNRKPRINFISVINGITVGADGIRRKFHCSHCGNGKSFKTKSHLQRHMLTHTGEKPYQCNECGSKFNQSSSLRNHIIAIHTKKFPHTCATCGKGFLMPAVLQKHIQTTGHQSAPTGAGMDESLAIESMLLQHGTGSGGGENLFCNGQSTINDQQQQPPLPQQQQTEHQLNQQDHNFIHNQEQQSIKKEFLDDDQVEMKPDLFYILSNASTS